MLDLSFNPISKFYEAPLQLKANCGVFVVDDFGRQRIRPRDLLNRWIVPLESRVDYLTLHTGKKFEVPFDVLIVFATNLNPESLADEAFLRRIPYKIYAKNPTAEEFVADLRAELSEEGPLLRPGGDRVPGAALLRAARPRDAGVPPARPRGPGDGHVPVPQPDARPSPASCSTRPAPTTSSTSRRDAPRGRRRGAGPRRAPRAAKAEKASRHGSSSVAPQSRTPAGRRLRPSPWFREQAGEFAARACIAGLFVVLAIAHRPPSSSRPGTSRGCCCS